MTLVSDLFEMVERFNREIIGLPIPSHPERLNSARKGWALTAMREELDEFEKTQDLADEADALIDLTYFALGRLVEMGIAPRPIFEEVHARNMAKVRGELSKRPGSLGYDAIKPEGWMPPDLRPYLMATQKDLLQIVELQAPRPKQRELPKILIIGYAGHGKDTVAAMLRDNHGLRFKSTSEFCAEQVIWPLVADAITLKEFAQKYRIQDAQAQRLRSMGRIMHDKYTSAQECFEDRANFRHFWYEAILRYNDPDFDRLAKNLLKENDIYCGMRNVYELSACRQAGLFDAIIWIDRSKHLPPEDFSSCTVTAHMADFIINNNSDLKSLEQEVDIVMTNIQMMRSEKEKQNAN
jgi:hypothetical protein